MQYEKLGQTYYLYRRCCCCCRVRGTLGALFPGNSADGSADIVRASVDENGVASFGCKSDNDYAGLVLNRKDKTFNFMQSYRFSAALSGTYEEDDDYLILTAKNSGSQSKFTFKKQKDGLEFLAKSPIPCGSSAILRIPKRLISA